MSAYALPSDNGAGAVYGAQADAGAVDVAVVAGVGAATTGIVVDVTSTPDDITVEVAAGTGRATSSIGIQSLGENDAAQYLLPADDGAGAVYAAPQSLPAAEDIYDVGEPPVFVTGRATSSIAITAASPISSITCSISAVTGRAVAQIAMSAISAPVANIDVAIVAQAGRAATQISMRRSYQGSVDSIGTVRTRNAFLPTSAP